MVEYIPTTEEVRDTYVEGRWEMFPDSKRDDLYWAYEFDRWLAQVKAEAWDEGWYAGLVAAQGAAPQADGENAAVARAIRIWTRQVRSELEATAEANIQLGEDYLHGIRSALMQAEDHAARLENDLYGDKPTPVLPSSGVDEDALAEVIAIARNRWAIYGTEAEPLEKHVARAVAEWLKGQER